MDDDARQLFESAKKASDSLLLLDEAKINEVLRAIAKETVSKTHYILSENQKDLQRMDKTNPKYDRLQLTEKRIQDIAADINNVANLPSPVGAILEDRQLENGLHLVKKTVPFGVIGVIFESRPNVCFDVFSLCFKTSNACILKGGSDAHFSNNAIVEIIRDVLDNYGINPNICTLLPSDREYVNKLLEARGYVDLIIPRGGKSLIDFVRENSFIPVIETGAGVCHTYFHKDGDLEKAKNIINNAKTRRVSVCNSLDCLIIDNARLDDLEIITKELEKSNVSLYADRASFNALQGKYPTNLLFEATDESFGTEFLDYKMSIKTVNNINEAIDHISKYGSQHSEAIITEDAKSVLLFEKLVDAACVYINTSTAFTDGAQFGLGAEIGISTQKMHARGPMALGEICSYKWVIDSNGLIRN